MVAAASVLWVNGPFGVGKTTSCRALRDADRSWRLADPEILGIYLREAEQQGRGDFQDLAGWPRLVVAGIAALEPTPQRPVAVPMSVLDARVWVGVRVHLEAAGLSVRHVILTADPHELERRIEAGFTGPGAEQGSDAARAWRRERAAAFAAALDWLPTAGTVLDTTGLSPAEVASRLLSW
jgi:hypothetical protein